MSLDSARQIMKDIKKGNLKPVYLLTGEEPYFIDTISKFIEQNVLTEEEKGFNQTVLYGRDVEIQDIVNTAKRYPMGAERQVVIVKEAQDLSRTIENLVPYVKNPQPTTLLVLCYKYKKLDGRKALKKTIAKHGVVFEGKKLYDNQIPTWIKDKLRGQNLTITVKASEMLVEFLGTDLGKIDNELEKLQLVVGSGQQITPELIEANIGLSKDFNNFELQNAIGYGDRKKAFTILQYFAQNPKNHPLPLTIGILYNFYSKLMVYHSYTNRQEALASLKVNPFFYRDYEVAARNIPMKKVSAVIAALREVDKKSKGLGANMSEADLRKELYVAIL